MHHELCNQLEHSAVPSEGRVVVRDVLLDCVVGSATVATVSVVNFDSVAVRDSERAGIDQLYFH